MLNTKVTNSISGAKMAGSAEKVTLETAKETLRALCEEGLPEADIAKAVEILRNKLSHLEGAALAEFSKDILKLRRQAACGSVGILDEKTLNGFLEKAFKKMREDEVKREVKKHLQLMTEIIAKGVESAREKRLLALSSMGLALSAPTDFSSDVSSWLKRLQAKAKDLSLPDLRSYRATPKLNESLKRLLKDKDADAPELATSALILAQLGTPQETLVKLVEEHDLKGLEQLLSGFTSQNSAQLSLDPLERIKQVAESDPGGLPPSASPRRPKESTPPKGRKVP